MPAASGRPTRLEQCCNSSWVACRLGCQHEARQPLPFCQDQTRVALRRLAWQHAHCPLPSALPCAVITNRTKPVGWSLGRTAHVAMCFAAPTPWGPCCPCLPMCRCAPCWPGWMGAERRHWPQCGSRCCRQRWAERATAGPCDKAAARAAGPPATSAARQAAAWRCPQDGIMAPRHAVPRNALPVRPTSAHKARRPPHSQ